MTAISTLIMVSVIYMVSFNVSAQKENEILLRRLCSQIGGSVLPTAVAVKLLSELRSKTVGQTTSFRGPLEIGELQINVYCYTQTKQVNMPTLQKWSTLATCTCAEG